MWHRLSVHVKRQESGSNQTAVIKPLTNTYNNPGMEFSDLSTKTLYNVAEEDEGEPVRYNSSDQHLPQNSVLPQRVIPEGMAKFNSNASDLDAIIRLPEPGHGFRSTAGQPVMPVHLGSYPDEPASPLEDIENEQFGLLHGYMYDNAQIHDDEELVQIKMAMEDSVALMPPSPFRDSLGSGSPVPNSPVSESILCMPPSMTYASVILGDFRQSSSTL